jgi:DNA-binding transcriptional LysR family regulator
MDWDNVRVFLAVARAGQFVAGARRLHLDHATASRRVAALEAALGAKLFDRRTTGARLTSAGERFLLAAEQMESAFLHAQAEVSDIDVELTGEVRIGAPDGFSTYYLAGALRDFVEKHPGVRLQLAPLPQLTPLAGARSTSSSDWTSRKRAVSWRASSPITRWAFTPAPLISRLTRRPASSANSADID